MKSVFNRAAAAVMSAAILFTFNTFTSVCDYSYAEGKEAIWPVPADYRNITTYFSPERNTSDYSGYHNAIDIEADTGVDIYAVRGGTVVAADWMGGYGNMVVLQHEDLGIYTFYAHASQLSVSVGMTVNQGDLIGSVGSTGDSSGSHLHYGICDTLQSGWPAVTYYDPLSYFTYTDNPTQPQAPSTGAAQWEGSDEYAGIYTTKDVKTYLNIRSGPGTNYQIVGKVDAGETVEVKKGDGKWAQIEHNGVKGYCSMDFIEKKTDVMTGMTITGVTQPSGTIAAGSTFSIKGKITSSLDVTKVWGGVYTKEGKATEQIAEAAPNAKTYDLSLYFDKVIAFNKLAAGDYIYRIQAQDKDGKTYDLTESEFTVAAPKAEVLYGDMNLDGKLAVTDAVFLQSYILGRCELTLEQFKRADMNGDGAVNAFDLVLLKRKIFS